MRRINFKKIIFCQMIFVDLSMSYINIFYYIGGLSYTPARKLVTHSQYVNICRVTKLLLKTVSSFYFFYSRRSSANSIIPSKYINEYTMSLENKTFLCGGKAKLYKVYKCSLALFLVVMFVYGAVHQRHNPKRGQEDYWYTGTELKDLKAYF